MVSVGHDNGSTLHGALDMGHHFGIIQAVERGQLTVFPFGRVNRRARYCALDMGPNLTALIAEHAKELTQLNPRRQLEGQAVFFGTLLGELVTHHAAL